MRAISGAARQGRSVGGTARACCGRGGRDSLLRGPTQRCASAAVGTPPPAGEGAWACATTSPSVGTPRFPARWAAPCRRRRPHLSLPRTPRRRQNIPVRGGTLCLPPTRWGSGTGRRGRLAPSRSSARAPSCRPRGLRRRRRRGC